MSGFDVRGTGGGGGLTPPANPGDDGFIAIANAGDLTYVGGAAAGQTIVWSGAAWGAGALDLADTDAVTGQLPFARFPAGAAAGQTMVWNGAVWAAGALDLADVDAVTGQLPFARLQVGTAAGQTLIWSGAAWGAGALDLADTDAVTGQLPFARFPAGGAAGQTMVWNGAVWAAGALDLADSDARTGLLPVTSLALGAANTVLFSDGATNAFSGNPIVTSMRATSHEIIGAGANVPATGQIRFASNTFTITHRNNADTGDLTFIAANSGDYTIGNSSVPLIFNGAGSVSLRVSGTQRVSVQPTLVTLDVVTLQFVTGVASPVINQANETGVGATADDLKIQAQSATGGGASVGGSLILGGGTGATLGNVKLQVNNTDKFVIGNSVVETLNTIFQFDGAIGSCAITIEASAGATSALTVQGQNAGGANNGGGRLNLVGGNGTGTGVEKGVGLCVDGTTSVMLEVLDMDTTRRIVAMCKNAAIAAGDMPANTGVQVIWISNAATNPTANPANGHIYYSTGGVPAWRTAGGDSIVWSLTSAAGATAGGGAAVPATVSEFLTVTYNGNVRKFPLFAN